jgi:hypothetical protein
VDIVTEGEAVNELCLVVEGTVEVVTTSMDPSDDADSCYNEDPGAGKATDNSTKNTNINELRNRRRPTSPILSTALPNGGWGSFTNGDGSPRTTTPSGNPNGGQGWLTEKVESLKRMSTTGNPTGEGSLLGRASPSGNGVTCGSPRGRHVRRGSSLKRQLGVLKDEALAVRELGAGNCFGEIAFFTEIPQHEVSLVVPG